MDIYSLKYYNKYNAIVKHYKELNLKKSTDIYTESHHVIPKCFGGSNHKDNLIRIPARVHFLLHWMLYRIYRTPAMAFAWHCMCRDKTGNRYNSKSFMYAKIVDSSAKKSKPSPMKGKKHSNEAKLKMSSSSKGKLTSSETKLKMSASAKGKPSHMKGKQKSKETLINMSKGQKGRIHPIEVKLKISNAIKNKSIVICPHCNKAGKGNAMKQWHFNMCKSLLN